MPIVNLRALLELVDELFAMLAGAFEQATGSTPYVMCGVRYY